MTTIKKPIKEYKLTSKFQKNEIGHKGFKKSENPKNKVLSIRISAKTSTFIDSLCDTLKITKTELFLGSLECYTGFNESVSIKNQKVIMKTLVTLKYGDHIKSLKK
jgi:hypothetical protein